jgi:hypothetical protein
VIVPGNRGRVKPHGRKPASQVRLAKNELGPDPFPARSASVFLRCQVHSVWRFSLRDYLISRIENCKEITVSPRTEVGAIEANGHLERIRWRDKATGVSDTHNIRHLFLMTAAEPNTGWLTGCVAMDCKNFVKTGTDLGQDWSLRHRSPYMLETSGWHRPWVKARWPFSSSTKLWRNNR